MKPVPSKPLITTIIPTYRRPKMLRHAVRSVLNQTYPHFQVCVYDNASGDETSEVVASIAKKDSRVKYHCHPENIGPIENFNYGMKNLVTPFFSLLSDDNVLLPNFFEDAITTLNHLEKPMLFAGQTTVINENGQRIRRSLEFWPSGLILPPNGLLAIVEKGIPNWESVLYRKQVIDNVGLLNPSFSGAADQDFMMRITRHHAIYVSKKEYAFFLSHKGSFTLKRDLSDTVSILKKRMEQWYNDEGLTDDAKERIKKASLRIIQKALVSHLIHKCIHGDDKETLNTASNLMRQELGWSSKVFKSIILAKLANTNSFMRELVISSINTYGRIKNFYKTPQQNIQILEQMKETSSKDAIKKNK